MRKRLTVLLLAGVLFLLFCCPAFAGVEPSVDADPEDLELKENEVIVVWDPADFSDIESYPDSEPLAVTVFFRPPEDAYSAYVTFDDAETGEEYYFQDLTLEGETAASHFWFGDYDTAPENLIRTVAHFNFCDEDGDSVGELASPAFWWDPAGPYETETVGASENIEDDWDDSEDSGFGDFALGILAVALFPLLSVGYAALKRKPNTAGKSTSDEDGDDDSFSLFRLDDDDATDTEDTWHSTGSGTIDEEAEPEPSEEPEKFRMGKPKIGLPQAKLPKVGLPHKKDRTVIDVDGEPIGNPFEMGKGRRKKNNPFEK